MARHAFTAALVALCAATLPALAHAGRQTISDPDDRPGALEIRSVSSVHAGASIRHTITTFGSWPTALIGPSTPNYLALGLDLSGNRRFERFVILVARDGRVHAFLVNPRGRVLDQLPATRPNGRSVSLRVPARLFEDQGGYSWMAFTRFVTAAGDVLDWAPNRGPIAHDVFAPEIELLSFPNPSTAASAEATVDVTFRISDPGKRASGVRRWTMQYRREDGPWENVGWVQGEGLKTVRVGGEEGVNWRFRVVVSDRHGNTRVSPVRAVSVPFDDANGVFAGAWSGTWTTVSLVGAPYLGNFRQTTAPGSAFTYTFTGSWFAWIGPGAPVGGPGKASVTIDGGPPAVIEQSAVSGDRAIVYEAKGLDPDVPHTVVVTHESGAIAFDAIVIR